MQSFEPSIDKPTYQWLRLEQDWVQETYGWSDISHVEAWGVFSHGVLLMVVSNQAVEDNDTEGVSSGDEMRWHVFLIYHQFLEGTNGIELIEIFESWDAAKKFVEESKEDSIQMIIDYVQS